ncbi:MAG: pyridoxamine 5'-phosphate oxidase family protein [Pseudomonadota bacterium]
MAEKFDALTDKHIEFIEKQHVFFVGTAASEGLINVSPKGMDSLKVIDNSTIIWLNLTGSGNETAAHVLENDRMTIMFCSFEKQPLILRLYGQARAIYRRDENWSEYFRHFKEYTGARQIFEVNLNMIQTSCGFAVPFYDFVSDRPVLEKWADKKGKEGIQEYWQEKNTISLDGKDTGIFK